VRLEACPLIDHRPVEAGDELLAQELIGRRPDLADDLVLPPGAGAVVAVGRRLIHPDTIAQDGRAVVISFCNDVFIIMSVDDLAPFGYK